MPPSMSRCPRGSTSVETTTFSIGRYTPPSEPPKSRIMKTFQMSVRRFSGESTEVSTEIGLTVGSMRARLNRDSFRTSSRTKLSRLQMMPACAHVSFTAVTSSVTSASLRRTFNASSWSDCTRCSRTASTMPSGPLVSGPVGSSVPSEQAPRISATAMRTDSRFLGLALLVTYSSVAE